MIFQKLFLHFQRKANSTDGFEGFSGSGTSKTMTKRNTIKVNLRKSSSDSGSNGSRRRNSTGCDMRKSSSSSSCGRNSSATGDLHRF